MSVGRGTRTQAILDVSCVPVGGCVREQAMVAPRALVAFPPDTSQPAGLLGISGMSPTLVNMIDVHASKRLAPAVSSLKPRADAARAVESSKRTRTKLLFTMDAHACERELKEG